MQFRRITEDYAVSAQIDPQDMQAIKAAGFRSVVCHRPDGEQPGQPSAAAVRAAAEAAGLQFRHIPVASGAPARPDQIAEMRNALAEVDGPVFAYCRSGTRSANIFLAARG